MTHTLNRIGLTEAGSGEEIVFLAMVQAKRKHEKAEEMKELASLVMKYKPDNFIGAPTGFTPETIVKVAGRMSVITAVFRDLETVAGLVQEIKNKKLGISVVLSGLFSDVNHVCRETGLKEHTHHISLGVFGRTEQLPDRDVLEITTQCGHALISPHYVRHLLKKVSRGRMTSREAARLLIKPCVCGIGNPERIERILDRTAAGEN
jgi:hypothetical protein